MPIQHDTKGEITQPYGKIRDWSKGECEPIPGKTMPNLIETELDYTKLYEKWIALGPGGAKTMGAEAMTWSSEEEYQEIGKRNGLVDNKEYVSYGCPSIYSAKQAADAVLGLSSTTNGKVAVKAWEACETELDD